MFGIILIKEERTVVSRFAYLMRSLMMTDDNTQKSAIACASMMRLQAQATGNRFTSRQHGFTLSLESCVGLIHTKGEEL